MELKDLFECMCNNNDSRMMKSISLMSQLSALIIKTFCSADYLLQTNGVEVRTAVPIVECRQYVTQKADKSLHNF